MTARAARLPVGTNVWVCESNFLTCNPHNPRGEHLLSLNKTEYAADLRRVEGHAFLQCRVCEPPTYFFAVFVARPSPMVTCYEISKECFDQWDKDPEAVTLSTPEMLYRLRDPQGRSYNPYYRVR